MACGRPLAHRYGLAAGPRCLTALGPWERTDGSVLPSTSDGFATALALLALQEAGVALSEAPLAKGLEWLSANQDPTTGSWPASSVNRRRDANSDRGKFMNDAATAYAALVLSRGGSSLVR